MSALEIETPSWGYGDSGTRFATFRQPGWPRNVFERIEDAAEVHRVTGTAPAVALHFPWDSVEEVAALGSHARGLGLRIGAVNPNLFQDPDYKLGSITHPDERIREKALEHLLECSSIATELGSTALSLWFADGTNYPGQDDLALRRRRLQAAWPRVRGHAPGPGVAARVQAVRARVLRDGPGRLGLGAARLPEARGTGTRARRPRPPRPGHERRADRGDPQRRGQAGRLPLQQSQVRG